MMTYKMIFASAVERRYNMSTVTGFSIINNANGEKLATLPLTIPIGQTVEGFQVAGYDVSWTWGDDLA
jgi:hypothetical protein